MVKSSAAGWWMGARADELLQINGLVTQQLACRWAYFSMSMDANNTPVSSYCRAVSMVSQDCCTCVYSWCRCWSPERGTGGGTTLIFFPTVQDMFGYWEKSYGNEISVMVASLRSWQLLAWILHIGSLFQVTVCWQSNSRLGQLFKCPGSPV